MGLLLKRALDQAAVWHAGQARKYPGVVVPYMSHVAGVAAILSRHGFDEEVVAAGALHDVMEDCGVTEADVAAVFGARVARLVSLASEQDKRLSWEERKRAYLEQFRDKPWEAQAVSVADKIDNFESIIVCAATYGDPWKMFKRGKAAQVERFEEMASLLEAAAAHPLIDEYRVVLERVRLVPES